MWFVVSVSVVAAIFFLDFLMDLLWGLRLFFFLSPRLVVKLKEKRRQISWIERKRRLTPDEGKEAVALLDIIDRTLDNRPQHSELKSVLSGVDERFRATLRKHRRNGLVEFIDSIWIVVVAALLIRFFVFESFRVPTGSMVPTIYIGDMLFVNKYIYGLRPPFTKSHFFPLKKAERGEVVVFSFPLDPSINFVKRVVGLPGDTVRLDGRKITVNGAEIGRKFVREFKYIQTDGSERICDLYEETNLGGVKYPVLYSKTEPFETARGCRLCNSEFTVPDGMMFVMGDNRDNSSDSRYWGFVPMENLKGRPSLIWFSVSSEGGFHLDRIGKWIN